MVTSRALMSASVCSGNALVRECMHQMKNMENVDIFVCVAGWSNVGVVAIENF